MGCGSGMGIGCGDVEHERLGWGITIGAWGIWVGGTETEEHDWTKDLRFFWCGI